MMEQYKRGLNEMQNRKTPGLDGLVDQLFNLLFQHVKRFQIDAGIGYIPRNSIKHCFLGNNDHEKILAVLFSEST
jgi:hypothetical protein